VKYLILSFAMLLILAACDKKPLEQPPLVELSASQTEDARQAANSIIGKNGKALFICGQADGLGLFTADWPKGFSPDGMKDGRLVFLVRNDGKPDLYFRDATGAYLSAIDDGGEVRQITEPNRKIESWVIWYASTGITETHNITTAPGSNLVDIWTSNKPVSLIGASAKLFRSSCVRA
jgi:hypothetical protein